MKKLTHAEVDAFVEGLLEPQQKEDASSVFKQLMATRQKMGPQVAQGFNNDLTGSDKLEGEAPSLAQSQDLIKRVGDMN